MIRRAYLPCLAVFGLTLTLFGCATTSGTDSHFEPLQASKVQPEEFTEPAPRPMADILREAQENFEAANNAQEDGDNEAALTHYTRMLGLLSEANFDPAVFYNLRSEFTRILEGSEQYAKHVERYPSVPREVRPSDIAERALGDIHIEFPLSRRIIGEIEEIQKLYPRNFQGGLDRSHRYLPYIRAELAKAGLPLDVSWLAMVESQFSPQVVSRAGAAGMWQFMPATGTRFGLRRDHYVDERFNWKKSTHAAIRYLTDLHARFDGDWELAVTAYNMGEGGLERTIAAAGETNLWRLLDSPNNTRMQQETRKFYPKFAASLLVANSPEDFGFKSNPQPAEKTTPVKIRGSYSLAALDKASGLPEGTLRSLNRELIRGVTPPQGEFELAVPPEASARLITALHQVPRAQTEPAAIARGGGVTHTVRRGETLSGIASRHRVSVNSIMAANNLRSRNHLLQGTRLTIPGASAPQPAGQSAAPGGAYTVKRGDTLYDIARAHNVTIKDLQTWNNKRNTRIAPGEKLVLAPAGQQSQGAARAQATEITHVVKAGDNPGIIAQRYGVGLNDFLAWNNLTRSSTIRVGQKLIVRGPRTGSSETAEAPEPPKETIHVVARGETPGGIAEKYNVGLSAFLRHNNLNQNSVIRVGQKLKVPAGQRAGAPQPKPEPKTHTVARGDNPSTIASRYDISLSELFKLNEWPRNVVLQIGDKVRVSS